jgi:hypothetical protein
LVSHCLEDWAQVQQVAMAIDENTAHDKYYPAPWRPYSTWVYDYIADMMLQFLSMGFQQQLYAESEFLVRTLPFPLYDILAPARC